MTFSIHLFCCWCRRRSNCSADATPRICHHTITPPPNPPTVQCWRCQPTSHSSLSGEANRERHTTSEIPSPTCFGYRMPRCTLWPVFFLYLIVFHSPGVILFDIFYGPFRFIAVKKLSSIFLLLEAFGNCRTSLNTRAARFTNILSFDFDQSGQIGSGSVQVLMPEENASLAAPKTKHLSPRLLRIGGRKTKGGHYFLFVMHTILSLGRGLGRRPNCLPLIVNANAVLPVCYEVVAERWGKVQL